MPKEHNVDITQIPDPGSATSDQDDILGFIESGDAEIRLGRSRFARPPVHSGTRPPTD
jgi:hypothetical protein